VGRMSIVHFCRAEGMFWAIEPLPDGVFVRIRGEARSSGPVAIIAGRGGEDLNWAAIRRGDDLREAGRRIRAGELGPFELLPGSGIGVEGGAKTSRLPDVPSPIVGILSPRATTTTIAEGHIGGVKHFAFGHGGGGGASSEHTPSTTAPKQPALVPSTFGWKPESGNWVTRAEHDEVLKNFREQNARLQEANKRDYASTNRAGRLADDAGILRAERDDLLKENAVLRRTVERLERKR